MASSVVMKIACMAIMCMMVMGAPLLTHADITCLKVENTVIPCSEYVTGNGGVVPQPCCTAVRTLNDEAKTTLDRQDICWCIRNVAQNLRGLNLSTFAALPANCGIHLPFKLSPSTDCNKYMHTPY
ncbi:non-specific lipid-transfer protein 1-like [Abrus precatorius]|uniref:Non-specific lipid-transfer protein n=1 Tax=Abrus precatorius TaxID=3816 RepID=A0A8B8K0V8_ABRPR|nr:non-specific lipid-transfer protein 1-like [Abrus precatorius]